jgi:glycosyltransferase involved in cell wall biosynthesis
MYHADLAVGLSGFLRKLPPLVWGIRGSSPRSPAHRRTTKLTIRMSALLSRWVPRRILFCSQRSRLEHIRFGYDRRKSVVIPNGFDLQTYRPSRESRSIVRQQLGISEDAPLIGMVARYHPQKDHPTFIRAAAILLKKIPQAQFLLCGQNVTAHNPALAFLLKEEGVERHFHLLGNRDDIPQLTAALDIASLSSSSIEAFPNVIGEAMACGISCVATDVGDTALIIGDTGVVVPPSDPAALAGGWHTQMSAGLEHRRKQGRRAFQRVRSEFSIDSIARRYEKFYLELLSETPR